MTMPVRLRLSRAKGFSLQTLSIATNGLTAVNCARPTRFGNPFRIGDLMEVGGKTFRVGSALHAQTLFRENVAAHYAGIAGMWSGPTDRRRGVLNARRWMQDVAALRNRNVACWCLHEAPCHADILLGLAKLGVCEAV